MNAAAIEALVAEAGLERLSDKAIEQFEAYLALLLKWNSRLNLTAIREPEGIVRRHFVECIQCSQLLGAETATLLDFGSGAGLPGIPIAICRPDIEVTLGESQGKKAAFLREAIRVLDLENADVFDRRIETMPQEHRFSVVTLRAVDQMGEACKTAITRLDPNGYMVIFATKKTEVEIKKILPEVEWCEERPTLGLSEGLLMVGQPSS